MKLQATLINTINFIRSFWKVPKRTDKKLGAQLTNRGAAISTLLSMIFIGISYSMEDRAGLNISLAMAILNPVIILLNYYGKYLAAVIYSFLLYIFMITMVVISYGSDVGGEYIYIIMIMSILIFNRSHKLRILFYTLVIFAYIFAHIWLSYNPPPLNALISPYTYHIFFFTTLSFVSIIILNYKQKVREFKTKTEDLLLSLKESNDKLNDKKAKVEEQNIQLKVQNDELERFAYIASHDLKTPLRNVVSFLNLIERKLPDDSSKDLKEYIDFAVKNSKQMYETVQGVLDYSKLNNKKPPLHEVDLNKVLNDAVSNLNHQINKHNAIIRYPSLPTINSNRTYLLSVFQNIIENGIKYNDNTTPIIEISHIKNNGHLQIIFEDNGIGIEQEYKNQVFEMFKRLPMDNQPPGTGIGLAICKKVMQILGGEIKIESFPGKGSSFIIKIPNN